ncbi:MAG: hypothetical protein B1H04_03200 [Planctomycetales bacterium 4484_123]|nr:MAG: hypothetical protein B1H04_03200 [Planctomycetales bacterium 4484_123]
MRTIAVTNQKGGVGKTTTVANLGAALAQHGLDVCLLDLDPQAHLTMHFGIDPSSAPATMYEVLTAEVPLSRAAVLAEPHLTIVPSVIDLAAAEVELAGVVGREQVLADALAAEPLPYELLLVDCPPSLGLLTLNALAAAKEVLIPLQPHFLALQGLGKLLETVALVQRRINPALRVFGIVLCLYESGTRLAAEVAEDVRQFLAAARASECPWSQTRIFTTRVRRNIKLAECPSHGTTIFRYDPLSRGAEDYQALAEEFLSTGADGELTCAATETDNACPPEPAQSSEPCPPAEPAMPQEGTYRPCQPPASPAGTPPEPSAPPRAEDSQPPSSKP